MSPIWRSFFLLLVLLAISAIPAHASITCAQGGVGCTVTTQTNCNGSTASCNIAVTATHANAVEVMCGNLLSATGTLTAATTDGTWILAASSLSHNTNTTQCEYNLHATGGVTTITCAISVAVSMDCEFFEFIITGPSAVFDTANTNTGSCTGTNCTVPGVALTLGNSNNHILVQAAFNTSAAWNSIDQSYNINSNASTGNSSAYKIATAAGTTPNWTSGTNTGAVAMGALAIYESTATPRGDDSDALYMNLMLGGFGVAALVGRLWGDQEDGQALLPPRLPVVQPELAIDSLYKEWRAFDMQNQTDDLPGFLGRPPVAIQNEEAESKLDAGWRAIPYDHTQETDRPGRIALPPFAIQDEGEYKRDASLAVTPAVEDDASDKAIPAVIVPFTGTEDGEQNWRIPGPPPYNLEDSAVQPPHRWGSWGGGSTPGQSAAPSTSTDEDQLFSLIPKPTLYDHTAETDEPGLGPTPPVAIQDDDSRWTATTSPVIEDDLRCTAPTPPTATDLDADPAKLVQPVSYDHTSESDEPGLGPTPPVAIQEDDLFARPVPEQTDESTAAEKTPVIVVTPNIGSDDLDGFFRTGGCVLQGADENADLTLARWGRFPGGGAAPAPAPPQNDQIEWYWADTKRGLSLDPGDADSERFIAPPTPFQATVEESESKFDAGWKAPAIEEENSDVGIIYPGGGGGVGPHRYPRLPESEEFKFDANWRAPALDDSDSYQPPAPPFVPKIELDQSDARDATMRSFQQDDTDTQRTLLPATPNASADEAESKIDATVRAIWHDDTDTQRTLPPTPPTSVTDEAENKIDGSTRAAQPDDPDAERFIAPPIPFQSTIEDGENKFDASWKVPAIEDDQSNRGVTPPTVVTDEAESKIEAGWRQNAHEDTESQRALPPSPPTAFTDDGENKRDAGWLQPFHDDTESQRALPPTPPTVFTDDAELNKRDAGWRQPWHEDTESQRALPPTAPQAIIDDGMFKLDVTWRQFFHDPEMHSVAPIVPPFVTTIGRDDDMQIYSGYRATFDTYREVLVFIRNKGRSYFYLLDA